MDGQSFASSASLDGGGVADHVPLGVRRAVFGLRASVARPVVLGSMAGAESPGAGQIRPPAG
eukprot:1441452-Alexandrium_andersonii.AAC.1